MFLTKLFKAIVINPLTEGFRRGGVALQKGENELELDEAQVKVFQDDPHMDIKILDVVKDNLVDAAQETVLHLAAARLNLPLATIVTVVELVDLLRQDENATGSLVDGAVNSAKQQIGEAVSDVITDSVNKVVEDFVTDLDLSTADEFLHPFITIIDAMNAEQPLTKKPNVKDLVFGFESDGHEQTLTPTAAQRDEAWEWYQANVSITAVDGGKEHVSPGNSENNTPVKTLETEDDA